jgi:SET domain-containing protein
MGADSTAAAIALGYGFPLQPFLHPNAKYQKDFNNGLLKYVCIKDIKKDEEITKNYNCDLKTKPRLV